jgi:hypothetical protein
MPSLPSAVFVLQIRSLHKGVSAMKKIALEDVILPGAATWSLGEALIPQEKSTIEP